MMTNLVNEIHGANETIRLPQLIITLQIIRVIQVHVCRIAAAAMMMTHRAMTILYHFSRII